MRGVLLLFATLALLSARAADVSVAAPTTASIQEAVDAAYASGGGRVVIPPGTWVVGTVVLKSNVELHLSKGAVLKATRNNTELREIPALPGHKAAYGLVVAWYAENISLTGEGELNGDGADYFETDRPADRWGRFFYRRRCGRPEVSLFKTFRCRKVRLEDVTLRDSSGWTGHVRMCEDVTINRVKFLNDVRWINSDGLDLDACRNVTMRHCKFLTGDDGIVLRAIVRPGLEGPTVLENVLIEDCEIESGCQCIRIGCPSDDTVRNCTLRRIKMSGHNGIYFDNPVAYLSSKDEGFVDVHDMTFEDFTGTVENYAVQATVASGIKIRGIRNCLFRNFDVHSKYAPRFVGNIWSKFENLRHENFRFNGELLPDGEFVGDFTNDKPLERRKKKISNLRPTAGTEQPAPRREGDVTYVAHAGEEYYAPPHSRAAHQTALDHGLDILKFDLHPTKDGQIVLNHDNTLKSSMNWDVAIRTKTLEEIREHRFRGRGGYTNEVIMTLTEALDLGLKAKVGVWLDFKEFSPKFFEQVITECDKAGLARERIMVATWTIKAIEYCRDHYPELKRVMHTGIRPPDGEHEGWRLNYTKKGPTKTFEFASEEDVAAELIAQRKDLGLYGFNLPVDIIRRNRLIYRTPDSVLKALKADGAWISMWFVEDEETGEKYRSLGADCFVTSNAARTRPGFRVQHGPAGATVGGEKRCKTDK